MGSMHGLTATFTGLLERGAVLVILIMVAANLWTSRLRFKQWERDRRHGSPKLSADKAAPK